jgi:hypothetical protein
MVVDESSRSFSSSLIEQISRSGFAFLQFLLE